MSDYGAGSYVCGQVLGGSAVDMESLCQPPIEGDTKVLYNMYKKNITSTKCSTSSAGAHGSVFG
jgi:hypothetical protein